MEWNGLDWIVLDWIQDLNSASVAEWIDIDRDTSSGQPKPKLKLQRSSTLHHIHQLLHLLHQPMRQKRRDAMSNAVQKKRCDK